MVRLLLCALIFAGSVPLRAEEPATRPHGSTTAPANAMPRADLEAIDRLELGDRYESARADAYYEVHKLLERYFTATSAEDRKALTRWMEEFGLDPDIVGRLVRVRMAWAALTPGCHPFSERVGPTEARYFIGVPKAYQRSAPTRLVVVLDAGESLPTGTKPDSEAATAFYTARVGVELGRHGDALVLMPVPHQTDGFGPGYAGTNVVLAALKQTAARVNVDPGRVDLVGYGNAAAAAWNLGLHYTTYFAAIAPFAGHANAEWQRVRLMNLHNSSVVAWHDVDDTVEKLRSTRDLTDTLKRMRVDVDLEQTRGVGHVPTAAVIESISAKLRERKRAVYPTEVNVVSDRPDTMFNRLDWVQMYQATRPGNDHTLLFRHGGSMLVDANAMSIKAKIIDNRIEVDPDNVESMRFYLNDQMIDFAKPVALVVNKKVRYQAVLKPNLDEMLRDQLFLGRGWRYFTARIDADFGAPTTRATTKPK